MKNIILLICSVFFIQVAAAQNNTIYIVRHAEKEVSNAKTNDPELSFEGKERALELRRVLKGKGISDVFTTNYIRTRNTGGPLRDLKGIPMHIYDASKPADLVKKIKEDYNKNNLLIVGHSNTVLEMIEAFGAKRPVDEITEDQYDYLFKVTIKGEKVSVSTSKYGPKKVKED